MTRVGAAARGGCRRSGAVVVAGCEDVSTGGRAWAADGFSPGATSTSPDESDDSTGTGCGDDVASGAVVATAGGGAVPCVAAAALRT